MLFPLALLLLAYPASAQPDSPGLQMPLAASPGSQAGGNPESHGGKPSKNKTRPVSVNVSAAQAARTARQEYGGKVLGVILEEDAHAPYYRVKLLDGGRVRVVHVSAHK